MKKVLITGTNSYLGTSFTTWLKQNHKDIDVSEISVRGNDWKLRSFCDYDCVLHLAGIAHVSAEKNMKDLYYKINTDLAIQVANKSREDGVRQFIFMSSMIVYGSVDDGMITLNTPENPTDFYGDSKLQAENGIKALESLKFKIAIIRPPMIYGPKAKGNYSKLSKFAKTFPVFPEYSNTRSMLFIGNLNLFLYNIINLECSGTFFPQNKEYICTSNLVKEISNVYKRKLYFTKGFNTVINLLKENRVIKKVFGNLYYEKSLSQYDFEYQHYTFEESIKLTEVVNEKSTDSK